MTNTGTRGRRTVILGGGITGLAAAWEAVGLGDDVRVHEASERFGGMIRTTPVELPGGESLVIDEAADAFLARVPDAVGLCRELGLEDHFTQPAAGRAMVWTPEGLKWFPAGSALGVPLDLDDLAETGLLSEEGFAQVAAESGRNDPPLLGDTSVGALLRSRFGDELVDRIVGPLVGGISAGDVDRMSVRACTPQIADAASAGGSLTDELRRRAAVAPDGPVFHGLEGGTATLVDALAERLTASGADLLAGSEAASADPEGLEADLVVLTTPASTTADLVETQSPRAAELLAAIETVSVVLVTLVFDAAELRAAGMTPPGGASGYLMPRSAGRFMAAVSWGSTKWAHWDDGRHVVLRASAGHRGDQRHLDMTDDEVVARMLDDIAATSGLRAQPLAARVSRWDDGFHQYDVGHLERVGEIESALAADTDDRLRVAGAAYRGVGIPACIRAGRQSVR